MEGGGNIKINMDTPPTILSINTASGPVLKIHQNGKIEYYGPVDSAADAFLNSIEIKLNGKYVNERIVLERLYEKLHNITDNLDNMSGNQIVEYIKQVESDTHKSLAWTILSDNNAQIC
jgi:hypothetical protein